MPRHAERRVSAFTPEQLFDLVVDVEKYPEFLPWCRGAAITAQHEDGFEADLAIGFHLLRASYCSRITHHRPTRIDVKLVRGPFRYLVNHWRFQELGRQKTEIDFEVDFEFRSTVFSKAMSPLFGVAVQRMVHEFERRAQRLYSGTPEARAEVGR
jgi:coenzyme Q-binding protein COQ10